MTSRARSLLFGCLFLSGSTSLIYELLWTRIMSFSLGSTSMAFAAVLAVFFLGLAGGSVLGGRVARGLKHPFRVYGILELAVGLSAGILFPLLFRLHHLFAVVNLAGSEPAGVAFRFLVAAVALSIPTVAMGATMPILLEHIRRQGLRFEAGLGGLYGINTLGAFFGVYLATHWWMPRMGLDKTYFATVALNVIVFVIAYAAGAAPYAAGASAAASPASSPNAFPATSATSSNISSAIKGQETGIARYRIAGLLLLGTTGFTTLGYEVVWGRVLTISMEGSIYGIGATLGSFLAGIGLGGLLFAWAVRYLRTPARVFRAYVAVALCIVAYLALSRLVLPAEGYLLRAITHSMRNTAGLHLSFLTAILALLPITAGFGFMFPAAVSLYNHGVSDPARGAGFAYGLNTLCSVAGSLLSASFLMNKFGIEGVVFLNVMLLLLSLAVSVLIAETDPKARRAWAMAVFIPFVLAAGWWPEIDAKTVLVSAFDGKKPSLGGLFQNLAANFNPVNPLKGYKDGVGSTVTVTLTGRTYGIQSNGLPQSGRSMDPPHYNMESSLVGLYPVIHRPDAAHALVVGLGAGITAGVLHKAGIPDVEVIELEPSMAAICRSIYPAGKSPLDEKGVTLRQDDARNFLVRNLYRKDSKRWDIIASQPAHPWVSGAADLFTEDMFRLVHRNLADDGVFCQWFMPGGLDEEAFASICNAFGKVFGRVVIYRTTDASNGIYFIGSKGDARIDLAAVGKLFQRPDLLELLTLNEHPHPVNVLRYAVTGALAGADIGRPGPVNTDANAFIETRMPLLPKSGTVSLNQYGGNAFTGLLPESFTAAGPRESLFVLLSIDELSGNLGNGPGVGPAMGPGIGPGQARGERDSSRISRLGLFARHAPRPFREYYQMHMALAAGRLGPDSLDAVSRRTSGAIMKYQLRYLLLRKWPGFAGPEAPEADFDSLPEEFRSQVGSQWILSNAESGRFAAAKALEARITADTTIVLAARLLHAWSVQDAKLLNLDETAFRALYARTLTDWAKRPKYVSALQWYCEATDRRERARAVRGFIASQESKEADMLAAKAFSYKGSKDFHAAVRTFKEVIALNPMLFNAYLGLAECYGSLGLPGEFAELSRSLREIFPIEGVYAFRLKEVFELAGREARP